MERSTCHSSPSLVGHYGMDIYGGIIVQRLQVSLQLDPAHTDHSYWLQDISLLPPRPSHQVVLGLSMGAHGMQVLVRRTVGCRGCVEV